jgi:hypothetical protein
MEESQLRWLHYNHGEPGRRPDPPGRTRYTEGRQRWERRRRGAVGMAGDVAREVLAAADKACGPRQRVAQVLEEVIGAPLMSQAGVADVRGGVLTLVAAEPAVTYQLRMRWEQAILGLAGREVPDLGIHTVRFVASARRR